MRRIRLRTVLQHTALAVAAVQGTTLAALAVVDHRRKRTRKPAVFPASPPAR